MYVLRGKAVRAVREEIGYVALPVWPICSNCKYFAAEGRNTHCLQFKIAVGKISTCKNHEFGNLQDDEDPNGELFGEELI